jgi:hypothetical protein
MARPRLTPAKAEAGGAAVINAGRFKDRKSPKRRRPLGEPYATMDDNQCVYWAEFQMEMPWLSSGDRLLVRAACQLASRMDDGDLPVAAISTLGTILSKLGATPTDITKVQHGDDEDEDPDEHHFRQN